jgi:Asp-tRNA(Asn)/Glu-tRNA(Gln) amidotransferase A subunit family amidase
MATGPFVDTTITEIAAEFRAGTADPVRLVELTIEAAHASQPELNAFVTVCADDAVRDATRAKQEIADGVDRGPLHGVPIAVKDIVDTAGILTTMGSRYFQSNVPARDAEVVTRLRAAGAVIVGKTTTHEFAFGPTGDRAANGACANPRDPTRMAGGSSAGSAAAVGAGIVPLAVGTDTGGSVRIPAALCGVVGIRPTMGLIPTDGVFPLSWSLDSVGVLANDVAGTAAGWRVLAGSTEPSPSVVPSDIRVGLVTGAWFDRRDDTVRDRFDQFVHIPRRPGRTARARGGTRRGRASRAVRGGAVGRGLDDSRGTYADRAGALRSRSVATSSGGAGGVGDGVRGRIAGARTGASNRRRATGRFRRPDRADRTGCRSTVGHP